MLQNWIQAGGKHQLPFMSAASRILTGDGTVSCPKCQKDNLRAYFHVFDTKTKKGTLWVWCHACKTSIHLPRVRAKIQTYRDPFSELSIDKFAQLELEEGEAFLNKLNRMWKEHQTGYP